MGIPYIYIVCVEQLNEELQYTDNFPWGAEEIEMKTPPTPPEEVEHLLNILLEKVNCYSRFREKYDSLLS